jgi:hypothetical protein
LGLKRWVRLEFAGITLMRKGARGEWEGKIQGAAATEIFFFVILGGDPG